MRQYIPNEQMFIDHTSASEKHIYQISGEVQEKTDPSMVQPIRLAPPFEIPMEAKPLA